MTVVPTQALAGVNRYYFITAVLPLYVIPTISQKLCGMIRLRRRQSRPGDTRKLVSQGDNDFARMSPAA
jgi:hypothetical protein